MHDKTTNSGLGSAIGGLVLVGFLFTVAGD